MHDTIMAISLANHSNVEAWMSFFVPLAVLFAIYLLATAAIMRKPWKDRLVRVGVAGGLGLMAFVGPMLASPIPTGGCMEASSNPQILKALRGHQIESIRAACGEQGVVIGPVQS